MTFSPLISGTVPHHNKYSSRQGRAISRINQHHWAGNSGGDVRLTSPTAQASCTYIIYSDGRIMGQVPEEFRPWTTSTFEADAPAITIEVQNINGQVNGNDDDPQSWQISNAAYNSIVKLLVDVARRYNWGGIAVGNYRGHREFWQTACPGGFLWSKMSMTRSLAQALYSKGTSPLVPASPTVKGKTIWQLADETIEGLHGSGDARKKSLGSNYDAVQAEVNRRFGVGAVAKAPKSIAQLADEVLVGVHGNGDARKKSLGSNYDAVQAELNKRLGGGGVAPKGPNIAQLADAVLRGEYGNGEVRRVKLGKNATAVQNEINRRLKAVPVKKPSISQLADAVLRGEYGSGDARKAKLGANYAAVQAEVNRRVG